MFAPCALGAVLNDKTIPEFKVAVVAGAATAAETAELRALGCGVVLAPSSGDRTGVALTDSVLSKLRGSGRSSWNTAPTV